MFSLNPTPGSAIKSKSSAFSASSTPRYIIPSFFPLFMKIPFSFAAIILIKLSCFKFFIASTSFLKFSTISFICLSGLKILIASLYPVSLCSANTTDDVNPCPNALYTTKVSSITLSVILIYKKLNCFIY